jgi:hypothetical protein
MKERKDYASYMFRRRSVAICEFVNIEGLVFTPRPNAAQPCDALHGSHAGVERKKTR